MQVEDTRMYRVGEVAEHFNVSASTIYRAIESGLLDALRLGSAVRVPGWAVLAYTEACGQAYVTETAAETAPRVSHWGLSSQQADGLACVVCGADFLIAGAPRRPVGHSWNGSQVFACTDHDTHGEPGVGVAR
jgi:excisionase family DNA binding protein